MERVAVTAAEVVVAAEAAVARVVARAAERVVAFPRARRLAREHGRGKGGGGRENNERTGRPSPFCTSLWPNGCGPANAFSIITALYVF